MQIHAVRRHVGRLQAKTGELLESQLIRDLLGCPGIGEGQLGGALGELALLERLDPLEPSL